MPWRMYQSFKMHAIVKLLAYLTQFYIIKQLRLFIDSFSQLIELLFLCDVTDTISRKNKAPPYYCMPSQSYDGAVLSCVALYGFHNLKWCIAAVLSSQFLALLNAELKFKMNRLYLFYDWGILRYLRKTSLETIASSDTCRDESFSFRYQRKYCTSSSPPVREFKQHLELHRSPRKKFESIYTFAPNYNYTITLINFVNVFSLIRYYLSLKKGVALHLTQGCFVPRRRCGKFKNR